MTSSVNLARVTSNSLIAPCYLSLASLCNFCSFYLISAWSWTACCCFSCSNLTFIWLIFCYSDVIIKVLSDNSLVFFVISCSSWALTFFSIFTVYSCFHLALSFWSLSISASLFLTSSIILFLSLSRPLIIFYFSSIIFLRFVISPFNRLLATELL